MNAFLFVTLSLIPATMVVIALAWRKRPPGKINWIYGYRTDWSMKTQETWDFAHEYISVLWLRVGIPLWVFSVAAWLIGIRNDGADLGKITTVITLIQCVFLILPILPTERALRQTFDAKGKRRSA
jgi:hypothetical protein